MLAWIVLVVAILAEVTATLALKAAGDGRVLPIAVVVAGYGISFYALYLVLRTLEVGTVYAIWAGAGTALVAVAGMAFLGEAVSAAKLGSILLIIAGVIGLNLAGAH
jgi:small multidrug resistance pump